MKSFDIMFSDLTEDAQERLLETFETTGEDENWETFPLTTIERYDEEDDELIDDSDEDFDEPNY